MKVGFENGAVKLSRINQSSGKLSGTVNGSATKLGSYTFADDAKIMDYADGSAVVLSASRLAGVRIESSKVAYYELNGSGEIETLILKDVTGDMFSFGILTKDEELITGVDPTSGEPIVGGHSYTVVTNGTEVGPLVCQNITFPVSAGKAVRYKMDGTSLDKMYDLNEVKLISAEGGTAVASNQQKFNIAGGVQVYLKQYQSGLGTKYYVSSLDKVNSGDYTLTGWYDKAESAGGRMRVIIAVQK